MRELIVNTFVTLDGVMQAPGGPEEDTEGGFEHGGWSFGYWDEPMQAQMGELMGKPFDLVLGRKTYEIFASYWPHNPDEPVLDQRLKQVRAAMHLQLRTVLLLQRPQAGRHVGLDQV